MRALLLAAVLLALPLLASVASADACDPYPIGRCGAYQREAAVFCWDAATFAKSHTYVSATDADAIAVGTSALPPLPAALPPPADAVYANNANLIYLRTAPLQAFLADPANADLPSKSVWKEGNNLPGLQTRDATCGTFVWYEECHPPQWMGPIGLVNHAPDTLVA
jgi:hypothetical protein